MKCRSSQRKFSVEKGFLKNFANFTGKHLCWSVFLKVRKNFVKKILQHRCFSVKLAKFLRTPTLKNICQRLLLYMRQVAVQCWFQTLFSVLFYNDKKGTNLLRSWSRGKILFEFFNKLREKTLHGIVTYLMLIQHVLFSLEWLQWNL